MVDTAEILSIVCKYERKGMGKYSYAFLVWETTIKRTVVDVKEKSKCPKTLPCGTCDKMERKLEWQPLMETHCRLLHMQVEFETISKDYHKFSELLV